MLLMVMLKASTLILTVSILPTSSFSAGVTDVRDTIYHDSTAASFQLLMRLKGGASSSAKKKKKRTRKRKKKQTDEAGGKVKLNEAMKKDTSENLGDAIRERASELLADSKDEMVDPWIQKIDESLQSVGLAMGTCESRTDTGSFLTSIENEDVLADVEVSSGSVLANYFFKSHGGVHALQSFCSLFAVLSGFGSVMLPRTNSLQLILLKRCLQLAIIKHLSGLIAATTIAAKAIPEIGLSQARTWMEQLAIDPVSQYVFYSSSLLLWISTASTWWKALPQSSLLLLGPILLREVVSTAFVISDVLVLVTTSKDEKDNGSSTAMAILGTSASVVNAFMSILVTPNVWRAADPATKQRVLAKLVSRMSLLMELLVGVLLLVDSGLALWQKAIQPKSVALISVLIKLVVTRLYVHFLLVRRHKIQRVATSIRGGATALPNRILDVLLHPQESMGMDEKSSAALQETCCNRRLTWKDYAILGFQ